MWTHVGVRSERKEDQILSTKTEAGGDTGGEWMSAAHGLELNSWSVGSLNVWAGAYVSASATYTVLTSDEFVIAAN